ncbi:hypothetical protein GCM10025858_04690 [Alicyclobacillus sacchari]|nr:GtrA family protein [Alicyclobacillus sacchari]GMA55966.1 hypothetical protein GCM10025858_04690 [Alicyclobacillus sacchari]
MLNNYIWNDQITWRSPREGRKWNVKLPLFVAISLVGILITTLVMHACERIGFIVLRLDKRWAFSFQPYGPTS